MTSEPTSDHRDTSLLPNLSVAFGIAGLLPIPGFLASIAAILCGGVALRSGETDRGRARVGIILGTLGLLAPIVVLAIYCLVLGYPFPIHRYQPGH